MYRLRLTICIALFPILAAAVGIHKWTDEKGNVHFGDRPPASADSTEVVVKPNVYESPSIERNTATPESGSREVIMYSAQWCGYCKKARKYFQARGIAFKEYDVEKSQKGRRDYKKLKAKGVPVILVGDKRLNGFSISSFESIYGENAPSTPNTLL